MKRYWKKTIIVIAIFLSALVLLQITGAEATKETSKKKRKRKKGKVTCIICHNQLGKEKAEWVKQWQESVHGKNNVT